MDPRPEDALIALYDAALARHGDTAQGALWPNEADRQRRYDVMLDVLADAPAGRRLLLCDLGCGTGGLLARMRERGMDHIAYRGLDRSAEAIRLAQAKFPDADFRAVDLLADDADPAALDCDYLVANGLFTWRGPLGEADMEAFLDRMLALAWPRVGRGLAFNVMSPVVDWRRDDLFHAPMDAMARRLHALAGRRVRFRADYGLYEYTCYAWREAPPPAPAAGAEGAARGETPLPVPVLRPRLPAAERLLPYLRRMDASRVYSNFGPLLGEFEARMAALLQLSPGQVAAAGNGTAALVGAILATAGRARPERPLALLPAATFVATAAAALECGYEPWLVDIDPDDWMLDAGRLAAHPQLGRVGLVLPVSAYGRAVPQAPWARFQADTGIAVVIDGAACVEALVRDPSRVGTVPVALSLHATKALATGEGGCVLATDPECVARATQAMNFGFRTRREAESAGINGKMSEYHAAVGLAELDGWTAKRAAMAAVAESYRAHCRETGIEAGLHTAPTLASSYVLYACPDHAAADRVRARLDAEAIGHRLWYGLGLHRQAEYARCGRDALPVTDDLAPRLLGLPMAPDLGEDAIARVVAALRVALAP